MSYGLLYISYMNSSYFNEDIEIRIEQRDYSGTSYERLMTVGVPLIQTVDSSDDDMLDPFQGAEMEVNLFPETEFEYLALLTTDNRKFKLVIKDDTGNIWNGYLLPDFYEQEYCDYLGAVKLRATDGLATLKNLFYTVPDTEQFISLATVINTCLSRTDLGSGFKEAVEFREVNIDTDIATSPFAQLFIHSEFLRDDGTGDGKDCYTLLQSILKSFHSRIFQEDIDWIIVQTNVRKAEFVLRTIDIMDAVTDNATIDPLIAISTPDATIANLNAWLDSSGYMTSIAAWKKFVVKFDYGMRENLVWNADFSELDENGIPKYWEFNNMEFTIGLNTYKKYAIINDGIKLYKNPTDFDINENITSHGFSVYASSGNIIQLTFNWQGSSNTSSHTYLPFTIKNGNNYLNLNPFTNEYQWITNVFEFSTFKLINFPGDSASGSVNIQFEALIDGNVELIFFPIVSESYDRRFYVTIKNIKLLIFPGNDEPLYKNEVIITSIDENNNEIPSDYSIDLGDVPDIDNTQAVYKNALYYYDSLNAAYKPTSEWTVRGLAQTNTLVNLLSDEIARNRNTVRMKLTGSLRCHFKLLSTITDKGRKYLINRTQKNYQENEMNLTLIELYTDSGSFLKLKSGGYVKLKSGGKIKLNK